MKSKGGASITVRALANPGHCGVADYSRELASTLTEHGYSVDVQLRETDSASIASVLRSSVWLVSRQSRGPVVWQYASFAGSVRGVPLATWLVPLLSRLGGHACVTVLHEMYPPWGPSLTSRALSLVHRLLLMPILWASNAVIVTTEQRAKMLRRLPGLRRKVHMAPVFSNWPRVPYSGAKGRVVAVPGWGHPNIPVDMLLRAVTEVRGSVLLVGGPGPDTPAGADWEEAARRTESTIEFTGLLDPEEASSALSSAAVVLLPNAAGPMSSKGTLAASLRNGCPVVALRGPMTWRKVVEADAVVLAPAEDVAVAAALQGLLDDPGRARALGHRGRLLYEKEMSVEKFVGHLLGVSALPESVTSTREARRCPCQ